MGKPLPPLREIAARASKRPGPLRAMDAEVAAAARHDLLLYAGAACAGLVQFTTRAWVDTRLPHFELGFGLQAVTRWVQTNPDMQELMAFLAGGAETPAVKKWMAAGRKAWK